MLEELALLCFLSILFASLARILSIASLKIEKEFIKKNRRKTKIEEWQKFDLQTFENTTQTYFTIIVLRGSLNQKNCWDKVIVHLHNNFDAVKIGYFLIFFSAWV